jgi:hypothetical protein
MATVSTATQRQRFAEVTLAAVVTGSAVNTLPPEAIVAICFFYRGRLLVAIELKGKANVDIQRCAIFQVRFGSGREPAQRRNALLNARSVRPQRAIRTGSDMIETRANSTDVPASPRKIDVANNDFIGMVDSCALPIAT